MGSPVPSMQIGPVTVYFGEKNGKYPDGNQLVVTGPARRVLFDTPLVCNRLGAELDGAECIILSHVHEDHIAGLKHLQSVPVLAPEADVDAVRSVEGILRHYGYSPETSVRMVAKIEKDFHFWPRPDALGYPPGQVWELGGDVSVQAIPMPGHTGGHSVLMVQPGAIAFIGDIDLSSFGPYYGDACSDLGQFRESLQRIERLEARVWITSHHKGVITERETFLALLRAFREKVERREEAILAAISGRGCTVEALARRRFLYPPGYHDVYVHDAERKTVREHLASLVTNGRAVQEGEVYRAVCD